jgi:hypothetical protein
LQIFLNLEINIPCFCVSDEFRRGGRGRGRSCRLSLIRTMGVGGGGGVGGKGLALILTFSKETIKWGGGGGVYMELLYRNHWVSHEIEINFKFKNFLNKIY